MRALVSSLLVLAACGGGHSADDADDAPAIDGPSVADAGTADAGAVDARVCAPATYPIPYLDTDDERAALTAAVADFESATGASVTLEAGAVVSITAGAAPIPLALDDGIADPCARAEAGLRAFLIEHAAMFRLPTDLALRTCFYDDLTDSEIVRLEGGTYLDGRPMAGAPGDLVAHVRRAGALGFFAAGYVPVRDRVAIDVCLEPAALEAAVIGQPLTYQQFEACVPGDQGAVAIAEADTRIAGEPRVLLDDGGALHQVRVVEVLMAAARVGDEQIGSTLFCCAEASLDGCVGNYLIVDERTGEVLRQEPRCHTC